MVKLVKLFLDKFTTFLKITSNKPAALAPQMINRHIFTKTRTLVQFIQPTVSQWDVNINHQETSLCKNNTPDNYFFKQP